MKTKVVKTEKEWRKILSPEQYQVTRLKATEPPFMGKYWNYDEEGVYRCICCGAKLFTSGAKFDSGCGWPSFSMPVSEENVRTENDLSLGMHRTEVLCSECDAHLGHVFPDGPEPTGLRYCINSASLNFEKEDKSQR